MTRMLHASLRAARDRGDPVSVLIAAEWPIYSRFGYAPATLSADYVLHTRRPGAQCPGDPSRVRPVERDEFGRLAPEVFAQSGRRRAGQVNRDSGWWERNLGLGGREPREGLPHNWLVHESGNGPDGLLAWKATGHPSLIAPRQVIEVWLLADASEEAYRNLWSYLSGVDGVEQVKLPNRCVYEPVRWMLGDARSLVLSELVDFLWLRILDVPAALSARRYAVEDEFVLEVSDEAAGRFAAGRYRLSAGPDGAKCTATDAPADLEISQRTLASIYLGGFRLRELSPLGGVSEHTAGALDRLDLMFTTPLPPWNPTWF
jgi:predicted acetyltransferase